MSGSTMTRTARGLSIPHLLDRCCQVSALLGGLLMMALALMTVVSIVGRWASSLEYLGSLPFLGSLGPVTGDYELVEMGTATAIFLFLPYCHLRGGHVTVDLIVMHAPRLIQRLASIAAELLFLTTSVVMTWRLYHGLLDKQRYMETSMLLGLPLWWGYAAGVAGFVLLTLVCVYRSMTALLPGNDAAGRTGETP